MSQKIKDRIARHTGSLMNRTAAEQILEEAFLLEFILSEIAEVERRCETEALNKLRHVTAQIQKESDTIMITAERIAATVKPLTDATTAALALITNPQASTPDSTVTQLLSDVDAQTARLVAAEAPPVVTPMPTSP